MPCIRSSGKVESIRLDYAGHYSTLQHIRTRSPKGLKEHGRNQEKEKQLARKVAINLEIKQLDSELQKTIKQL